MDGEPLDRDQYAAHLQAQADTRAASGRRSLLHEHEAQAVAALLDELAGVYPGEPMGHLARDLAVRLYDRLGI